MKNDPMRKFDPARKIIERDVGENKKRKKVSTLLTTDNQKTKFGQ